MHVKLKVLSGTHAGKEIAIKQEKFVVGRSDDCDLRPKSESVSRKHCVFVQKDSRIFIADLKSRNGTFVNDVQLEPEKAKGLKSGDRIRIGQLDFEIEMEIGVGGAKKPEVRSVQEAVNRVADTSGSVSSDSRSSPIDIDSWLSEPDTFDRTRLPAGGQDTQMLGADDTSRVRVDTGTGDVGPDETISVEEARPKFPVKKGPMKLPKMHQQGPTTKNSKDAASNALKKYFGG